MSFFIKAAQAESANGKNLYNPLSGATGKYQFLPSTWNDLMTRKPGLGLTANGINDPLQQETAMQAFTEDNHGILTKTLGPDLTDADLYGAHHFGAGGYIKIRQAPPGTPIDQVLSGAAIKANPYLRGKTTDQVQSILQTKMGGPKAMTPEQELQAALAQEAAQRQTQKPPAPPPVQEMGNVGALSYPMQSHVGQGTVESTEELPMIAAMQGITGNRRDMVPGAVTPKRGFSSDALLRFGAGMLSGKDFNDGLARGALGISEANQDAQANEYKRQQMGLQTQQQQALIERYKSLDAKATKSDDWKSVPGKPNEFFRTGPGGEIEFKKMDGASSATETEKYDTKAAFTQLQDIRQSLKDDNLVGPIAGRVGPFWDQSGLGDPNRQAKRRELEMFSKQKVLEAAGNIKGALSDKDLKFLMESQPGTSDDNQTWNMWLNKVEDRMKYLAGQQGVDVGNKTPQAPSGDGWNATGSGVKFRIVN